MKKLFAAASSAFLFIATANAQTATDLGKKFPHHEVYELRPGVQMAAKFSADGQVCEIRVEQARFADDGVDLRNALNGNTDASVDQLVPPAERGKEERAWEECAGICMNVHEYSNVSVAVYSMKEPLLIQIKWRHRSCGP